ncbi:MAG TPA: EamA family transporter, partial [Gemmataceae bacterium]|nr:EamA family transporter [Gemmataceae bacterium]
MKNDGPAPLPRRPAPWQLALALALVYIAWGTTYLAIREGVRTLPPGLFAGTRVALAGLTLLAFLGVAGGTVRLSGRDAVLSWLSGAAMFVGGNGLLTFAEKTVPSGLAAVLAATIPLWMALLEMLLPHGERLTLRGWLGLLIGFGGVVLLGAGALGGRSGMSFLDVGPFLVLGSAAAWSVGSFLYRHSRSRAPHLTAAAYQMAFGGGAMIVVGLAMGEGGRLTADCLTWQAIGAFFYLLVVGSLVGFIAYNWLLGHASAALAGTYAYVNPVVALLVGWLLAG